MQVVHPTDSHRAPLDIDRNPPHADLDGFPEIRPIGRLRKPRRPHGMIATGGGGKNCDSNMRCRCTSRPNIEPHSMIGFSNGAPTTFSITCRIPDARRRARVSGIRLIAGFTCPFARRAIRGERLARWTCPNEIKPIERKRERVALVKLERVFWLRIDVDTDDLESRIGEAARGAATATIKVDCFEAPRRHFGLRDALLGQNKCPITIPIASGITGCASAAV